MARAGPRGTSTRSEAYNAIRDAIIDGRLQPGEHIREEHLAEQIKVSRTPVREALVALESEGLVTASGRGLTVRVFTAKEISDIYDVRAMIEPRVARMLTKTLKPYDLAMLRDIQAEYRDAFLRSSSEDSDSEEPRRTALHANRSFHVRLVDSLGNQALTAIVRQVVETPLFYHSVMWFDEPQLGRSVAQHETLLTAFEAGDEAAAETCWFGHIQEGKFTLLSNLERHSRQYYGAPEAEPLGTPR